MIHLRVDENAGINLTPKSGLRLPAVRPDAMLVGADIEKITALPIAVACEPTIRRADKDAVTVVKFTWNVAAVGRYIEDYLPLVLVPPDRTWRVLLRAGLELIYASINKIG